jgi:signal transduction histidine kinase
MGLRSMRKRAEMLEGNVRIDSEQAAATRVGDESTLRQVAPAA